MYALCQKAGDGDMGLLGVICPLRWGLLGTTRMLAVAAQVDLGGHVEQPGRQDGYGDLLEDDPVVRIQRDLHPLFDV